MKKRVVYVHHGKGLGGAPLSLLNLVEGLDRTKYHPIVLFLHDSEAVDLFRKKGIEVAGPANVYEFSHTKIWWYRWYHMHHLARAAWDTYQTMNGVASFWLDKLKPDIVHLNTSSLLGWGKAASEKGIPVVWHVREPMTHGYFGLRYNYVRSMVKKYADVIVPISHNDARPFVDSSKMTIIYDPVDRDEFSPARSPEATLEKYHLDAARPKILFVGGLSQEKGTLPILQILEKLLKKLPTAQLILVGYFDLEAPEKSSLKSMLIPRAYLPSTRYKHAVKEVLERIGHAVVFTGPLKEVAPVMAAADVVVFPATVGHCARPILEANAMAKPAIAPNMPPLNELIIDGKTGYLIDNNDQEIWVERLYRLLTDKALCQTLGHQAFDFCASKFDLHDHARNIEKQYERLV